MGVPFIFREVTLEHFLILWFLTGKPFETAHSINSFEIFIGLNKYIFTQLYSSINVCNPMPQSRSNFPSNLVCDLILYTPPRS